MKPTLSPVGSESDLRDGVVEATSGKDDSTLQPDNSDEMPQALLILHLLGVMVE